MTLRPHSLYTKIFFWFLLTNAATVLLILLIAGISSSQPFGRRWMEMTQDLYARSAVDFYTTGGGPALTRYLQQISNQSGIEGHLINSDGTDVLGGTVPAAAQSVYKHSLESGNSSIHLGRRWTAASVVQSPAKYIFVMEAHPRRGFVDGVFLFAAIPRIALALFLTAMFCLALARHITRPIRILQSAALQMASGNLRVRTLPALHGRNDELTSMATAFDGMAERMERLISTERQMLADISHELRSPLTRIGVSLELLRRGDLDVIEPMQGDLDRVDQMIGQVLQLMRFEISDEPQQLSGVDITPVVWDIVEDANREGRNVETTVSLMGADHPYFVNGEEQSLRSCFENVVRNALQHSPPRSLITVELSPLNNNHVRIRVTDAGRGVPPESLSKLFAPFYRVPETMVSHPTGTGIGLSLTARIVARYGGTIHAENRSPHGLSVIIQMPLAHSETAKL